MRRRVAIIVLAFAWWPRVGAAQSLTGYYLGSLVYSDESFFGPATAIGVQRARVMAAGALGPVNFDAAYEHLVTLRSAGGAGGAVLLDAASGTGNWLPLEGTIEASRRVSWQHQADRLAVGFRQGAVEVAVGRQAIAWGTTLFLSPADPFQPFDPADPFREYRVGIDAGRLRWFPGPLSEVDVVIRPAETAAGETMTALARARLDVGGLELSAWAGLLHDEAAAAFGVTATVSGALVRAEGTVRELDGARVLRLAVGVDRSFVVAERTLYIVAEYQHDELGAPTGPDLVRVAMSLAARRGELQVFGRDEMALQAGYRLHALWGASMLTLASLSDASALLSPGLSYEAASSITVRAGGFLGLGAESGAGGLPASEYGSTPLTLYLSLSAYF